MPISRAALEYVFRPDWMKNKMVFIAGPRQVGKTYLVREFLRKTSSLDLYYNWDDPRVAERYRKDPGFFESDARNLGLKRPTIAFDEIHKRSRWKNELKGTYDRFIDDFNIIVTGSARLDLLRQSGESLAGRYFLYRILPVGLQELCSEISIEAGFHDQKSLIERLAGVQANSTGLGELLKFGGFPDPLSQGSESYRRKWATDYRRLVLREDLRDLSRIQEIDRVETLWSLLPGRVGSPLSVRSLQEDLSASHEAVRTWLMNLEKLYSIFFLQPYSKKVSRAVKKERKAYLMDWALHTDESKKFENFVIASLFRSIAIWNDSAQGDFDLRYVRNGLGQEADFLILREGQPWFLGEVKLSSETIEPHLEKMSRELGGVPILQVVAKSGVFRVTQSTLVISADRLFKVFP